MGYRKVRRRVCRRIWRRVDELGLASFADYRERLEADPREWSQLDALTNVTISRFYRDRAVFDSIRTDVLPALVERARNSGSGTVRAWSAGCASGEEPYTLAMMWELEIAATAGSIGLQILGTDIKPTVLQRANKARYPSSALRDLPAAWREVAFSSEDGEQVLDSKFRGDVAFVQHDIRDDPPDGPFDLVLCRYQAFTYFDDAGQRNTSRAFARVTLPGAVLVLGGRESVPRGELGFRELVPRLGIFQRAL